MGSSHTKERKAKSHRTGGGGGTDKSTKKSAGGDKMKDEYVKFIMREQLRREKEFKDKCNDRDNMYRQIQSEEEKKNAFQLRMV